MADKLAPQDQEAEEARQLKDAVARLGASLREESERLKQDEAPDLPLPAAPRVKPDPRVDTLTEQVATLTAELASLAELQRQAVEQAEHLERDAAQARTRLEDTRRLAVIAVVMAGVAVVIAIAALLAAVAG
jgi:outer membrane murein-binding lipoprotein Lpp